MNVKSLISGIVIGSVITVTASAFADVATSRKVEAWLSDTVKIIVDGEEVALPEGFHILNYENRIYTPTSLVTSEMGGKVEWSEGRNAVLITKPEPQVVEVPVEKIVEVAPKIEYNELPVRLMLNDVTINIISAKNNMNNTLVHLDVNNSSMKDVILDHKNAYILANDVKYTSVYEESYTWGNSIMPSQEIKDGILPFVSMPSDITEVTICIPVVRNVYDQNEGYVKKTDLYKFNVKMSD